MKHANKAGANFHGAGITRYERTPKAIKTKIIGVEVTADAIQYQLPEAYRVDERDIFNSEADAVDRARELADQLNADELERILKKDKDTRSWSWNATYHRRCIRDAQKQIDYHTRKLDVAREMAKAQKANAEKAKQ